MEERKMAMMLSILLDCETGDLDTLGGCDTQLFYDCVDSLRENGRQITFNSLLDEMFRTARAWLEEAVRRRRRELVDAARLGRQERAELDTLCGLAPTEDMEWEIDGRASGMRLKNLATYKRHFQETLEDIETQLGMIEIEEG